MKFLSAFSLPLLMKEMIEQAQHKRTYIVRVVYGVVLYSAALFVYFIISSSQQASGGSTFGQGRMLFESLFLVQALMVLILLPPITCGSITVEKEKDTLALLLLTKLSPWTIVFEKLLSRIFAMGTFQLLSLPLFAIAYGIGGVELDGMLAAVAALFVLSILVGSVSIFCSAWFRTTSAAFIMTYVLLMFVFSGFSALIIPMYFRGFLTLNSVLGVALLTSLLFQVLSANVLFRRAFIPPKNLILILFQYADQFFNRLNEVTTGGIVLVRDNSSMPQDDPIGWRETQKKSLGTFRYQFRVLMLLLTPLFFDIAAVLTSIGSDFSSPFHWFQAFFWSVSIICLTVHSTGVVPSERIRQSLDVLLVAPISSKSIVLGKLSGVRRLIFVLSVPFIVLVMFQAIWTGYVLGGAGIRARSDFWMELISTSLAVLIYMPTIMWIGFQFGLRMRTQMQAILATVAFVGATCAIPAIFLELGKVIIDFTGNDWRATVGYAMVELRWFSPVEMMKVGGQSNQVVRVASGLTVPPAQSFAWLAIAIHFAFYAILYWRVRRNALTNFSRIVRRCEEDRNGTVDPSP